MRRLRWVKEEMERRHSGMQGLLNWALGRDRVRARDMYLKMAGEIGVELDDAGRELLAEQLASMVGGRQFGEAGVGL